MVACGVSLTKIDYSELGPSINGLVTDGNTKLCRRGFVLELFQSTSANKTDSEHTQDYTKFFPVCKFENITSYSNKIEVYHLFRFISDYFWLKVPEIAKKGTLVSC